MKKLVITLAAVAVAAVTQAASVDWGVKIPAPGGATYADYKVYICESVTAFENEAQISSYLLGDAGNTGTVKNNRGLGSASGSVSGLDNAKSGETQAFKVVIVDPDSKGYWVTDASAQIYTTETSHTDYTLADASTLLSTTATAWKTSPGPGPDPAPEPTSGLLLLLGMAGLALRRKQK